MQTIRCVAIDDEPLALNIVRSFCDRMGGMSVQTFTDPEAGLEAIAGSLPDIVFLDIEMENIDGLTLASRLPEGVCVIFTTAYLDYAIEGFNLDAVDYLHKPFAYSRFETAVAKAMRRIGTSAPAAQRSIVLKQEYSNVTLPLDDILYIETIERYCKVYRVSGGSVMSRVLLKDIASMLPEGGFLRIHRSYIVPRSKIVSYTRQEVRLTIGVTVPVGRQYAPAVLAALG